MTQSIHNQSVNANQPIDFDGLVQQLSQSIQAKGGSVVPGVNESVNKLLAQVKDSLLPTLSPPNVTGNKSLGQMGGLNLSGLSLETLMDAVGMAQRQTETKVGRQNLAARAEERQKANAEKLELVQKEVNDAKSKGVLDGLLKAFKIIGMILAAVAAVAMITVGAVGLAAGGSGAVLIAVGVASLYMVVDSIIQETTDGKMGIGPGFIAGKIAEACGASEETAKWIKFGVDIAVTIALCVVGGFAAAGKLAGSAAGVAATTTEKVSKLASTVAKATVIANGVNTIAQSAASIGAAVQERDSSFSLAEQKRLQALLERIAMANELDLDHLKAMMQRSEETLQMVSDIVKESVQTNIAIMTGSPSMA